MDGGNGSSWMRAESKGGAGQGSRGEQPPLLSQNTPQLTLLCLISSRMASREPGAALNAGHFMVTGAGSC